MDSLGLVTLLVRDYDEALAFYVGAAGFELVEDTPQGDKRWVVVRPRSSKGTGVLLAVADTPQQQARIGDQTGGRVCLFLNTDDFAARHTRMVAGGVRFIEEPRHEPYGTVAVFLDLFGNRWDLVQPKGDARLFRPMA